MVPDEIKEGSSSERACDNGQIFFLIHDVRILEQPN